MIRAAFCELCGEGLHRHRVAGRIGRDSLRCPDCAEWQGRKTAPVAVPMGPAPCTHPHLWPGRVEHHMRGGVRFQVTPFFCRDCGAVAERRLVVNERSVAELERREPCVPTSAVGGARGIAGSLTAAPPRA